MSESPSNCCSRLWGDVVLAGAPQTLELKGYRCEGDQSRLCCNAPAYGQMVVASGRLTREGYRWILNDARLCRER